MENRVRTGVAAGANCVGVGRGVEEKLNRGVTLNCWVLGRGVKDCVKGVLRTGAASFLIMNRWGDGVYITILDLALKRM